MSNMHTVSGYLTQDAETRGDYIELNIADNPVGKAKERYATMFVRATFKLPNPVAEIAADCKKGDFVVVSGQLQVREYTSKKTKKRGFAYEIPFATLTKPYDKSKDGDGDDAGGDDDAPADDGGAEDAFPGA